MEKEKYKLGENNFFECGFLSLSPPYIRLSAGEDRAKSYWK